MSEPATVTGPYSGRFFEVEAADHTYRYVKNDSLTEGQWTEEYYGENCGAPSRVVIALLNYILESRSSTTE